MTALLRLFAQRLEVVARAAVAHVELVSDDREPHRMNAEQQLAVLDSVTSEI